MILAQTSLAVEPAYPWSIPTLGPAALLVCALLLVLLTIWAYVGVAQATWQRIGAMLALRLAALAVVFLMLLRPSLVMTHLEGIETSGLLVVVDASASMNVSEQDGKPTRWQEMNDLWKSPSIQRRLRELAADEKIELVKYTAAEVVRLEAKDAQPDGRRTDIGAWLHELWLKHGHEKRVRGIVLFSDGADNGTRFASVEQAGKWRGVAPIHAFGVGDPNNARFKKDLALTRLDVRPEPLFVKSKMTIDAVIQAPGFERAAFSGEIMIKNLKTEKTQKLKDIPEFRIDNPKEQKLRLEAVAPEEGEYKVTVKVKAHPDETNTQNNEISTYIQVVKEQLHILWVDRPRVYEPKAIMDFALKPERDVKITYVEVRPGMTGDPLKLYRLEQHYDVIVIGDIAAKQFALGNAEVFGRIKTMVEANKTGLLMLGGSETFASGGWKDHPALMGLLPVDFNLKGKKALDLTGVVRAQPTPDGLKEKFGQLDVDAKASEKVWNEVFEPLHGAAPVGNLVAGNTSMIQGKNGEPVLVVTRIGEGRTAVFAGDSTAEAWLGSDRAVAAFARFWKQLVFWLAQHEDRSQPLVVKLDRRRMTTDASDALGFTATLRDKNGNAVARPQFTAKVLHQGKEEYPVRVGADGRGVFQGARSPGEHVLSVEGSGQDASGNSIAGSAAARFLVAADDSETLRLAADHDTLARIANASGGQFRPASEAALLQMLDELGAHVAREGRHKTAHWPDWNRVPPSTETRDQLAGIWHSFAALGVLLFTALLVTEWLLRRMWGLV